MADEAAEFEELESQVNGQKYGAHTLIRRPVEVTWFTGKDKTESRIGFLMGLGPFVTLVADERFLLIKYEAVISIEQYVPRDEGTVQ